MINVNKHTYYSSNFILFPSFSFISTKQNINTSDHSKVTILFFKSTTATHNTTTISIENLCYFPLLFLLVFFIAFIANFSSESLSFSSVSFNFFCSKIQFSRVSISLFSALLLDQFKEHLIRTTTQTIICPHKKDITSIFCFS